MFATVFGFLVSHWGALAAVAGGYSTKIGQDAVVVKVRAWLAAKKAKAQADAAKAKTDIQALKDYIDSKFTGLEGDAAKAAGQVAAAVKAKL